LAIHRKVSFVAAVFCPDVMTFATPRPASIITRVLMNGCSPTTDTSTPLTRPRTTLMPSARARAVSAAPGVFPAPASSSMEAAPATTITEPTERSIPLVATTRHMPSAIIITGAAARRMSITLPTSAPLLAL